MEFFMQTAEAIGFTNEDYLVWEEAQAQKHEFLNGEVFAMGGARQAHVVVSLNVAAYLKQHLRTKPCRTYISDMKLRVEQVDAFFYPDVMVSCDKSDHRAEQFISNPVVIVEVLSDSTEAYDRGAKFSAYRYIESLQEYFLIDIAEKRIECFRRTPDNDWLLHVYEAGSTCEFVGLQCSIALSDIFEDVT